MNELPHGTVQLNCSYYHKYLLFRSSVINQFRDTICRDISIWIKLMRRHKTQKNEQRWYWESLLFILWPINETFICSSSQPAPACWFYNKSVSVWYDIAHTSRLVSSTNCDPSLLWLRLLHSSLLLNSDLRVCSSGSL